MKQTRLATSLTIGTFLWTLITGLALTLELGAGAMRSSHEWMGLFFGVFGIFHALTYKNQIFAYFKGEARNIISSALLAGVLFYMLSFGDIHASSAAFEKLSHAPLETLAPVLGTSESEIIRNLRDMGIAVTDTGQSLQQLAKANRRELHELMETLLTI